VLPYQQLLRDRFPQLPDVTLENTWISYIFMSRNGTPASGQVAHNVWMSACQNGIGVTKGTISGESIADLAYNQESSLIEDLKALGSPVDLSAKPLLELGARAMMKWEVWKNRHES